MNRALLLISFAASSCMRVDVGAFLLSLETGSLQRCRAPVSARGQCSIRSIHTGEEHETSVSCKGATYSSVGLIRDNQLSHTIIADASVVSLPYKQRHGCAGGVQSDIDSQGAWALLVDRGVCPFTAKAHLAQEQHASLLVIVDRSVNASQPLTSPSFETDDDALVPAVLIREEDSALLGGARISVNLTISDDDLVLGLMSHGLKLGDKEGEGGDDEGYHCLLAAVETARALNSSNADPYHHLANYHHRRRRVDEAYALFQEALLVDPSHLPALTNLPTLLYKYDVNGLSHAQKEREFQACRCIAQELVVAQLSPPPGAGCDKRAVVRDWRTRPEEVELTRILTQWDGEYGVDAPLVLDPAHLQGLPLNPPNDPKWAHLHYADRHVYAALMRNVSVMGDPGVSMSGCSVFVPSPQCFVPLHSLLDAPFPPPRQYKHALLAVQMAGGSNYFHWTTECLSRLILVLDHVIASSEGQLPMGTRLVLPGPRQSYVEEALERIAAFSEDHAALLEEVVVEYYEPRRHAFHADTLVTVDWRQRDDDHRPGLELAAPRSALRRVREVMSPSAADVGVQEGSCHRHVIVWISRNTDRLSGKGSRSVLNEDEVLGAMRAFVEQRDGWEMEVFHGDAMDLEATVALFSRATVVMGVHGAGLVNVVYSREGTHVVEIALATPRHRDYMHMSVALGHKYWMLPAPEQALEAAIRVNVEHIVGVLRRVAGEQA